MTKAPIKLYYEVFPIIDNSGEKIGEVARPIVYLILNYKHGKMFGPMGAILDSGADYNLFPAEVADILGINLMKGEEKLNEGIGGKRVKTYRHTGIKMFVESYNFDTSIDFSKEISVPLLGQQGFFDKFKTITFARPTVELILTPTQNT